jgi:hypothetical protein
MPNKMTPKERCLALLTRNGSASPSLMMQRCHVSAGELKGIVAELEQEGKIKAWPYRTRQGMTAIYTLPGAKDPRPPEVLMVKGEAPKPEKKAVPSNDATVASKRQRSVNQRQFDSSAPATAPVAKPSPSSGSGHFAAVIADLEMRCDAINRALEGLRALA